MNKKAFLGSVLGAVLSIIIIVLCFVFIGYYLTLEDKLEEKCEELGLELFDYSAGGIFSSESYSCWNPITKEVKLIK